MVYDEGPMILTMLNSNPLYPAVLTLDMSKIMLLIAETVNLPRSFPPPTAIHPLLSGPISSVQQEPDGDVE